MRALFAILIFLSPLAYAEDDDVEAMVRACGRGRSQELAQLFERFNLAVVEQIEGVLKLGGDDAAEVAQAIWSGLYSGQYRLPPDLTTHAKFVNWMTSVARNIVSTRRRENFAKNVTPDLEDPNAEDPLQQVEESLHVNGAIRAEDLELLADRLHRLLLLMVDEGMTGDQIAQELGRGRRWVNKNLADARLSFSEVLKGHPPLLNPQVRPPDLLQIVEEKMQPVARIRPVRMPKDAVKITETEFHRILARFSPKAKEIAWKYFVEGKHGGDVMAETGATQSNLLDVPKTVSNAVSRRFSEGHISVERIWIVDAEGVPLSPYRQLDRAGPAKNPVKVRGAVFWKTIEDWNLESQQIMHMRFVERLTPIYIAFAMGRNKKGVETAINQGLNKLKEATSLPLTLANLEVVGDVSMMQIDAITLPAHRFLSDLERSGDPSTQAKLRLASRYSSLPVTNLQCLVLTKENGEPLASTQQRNWAYPPYAPVEHIARADFKRALGTLWNEPARATDLYVNHRWSLSTITFYLGISQNTLGDYLGQGRNALRDTLGKPELSLTQLLITE